MPDRIGKARSQMTRYRRLGRGGECCARACNDFRARRNGKGSRAVSWAAIIAGALAIAAASLILLALGSGLAQEEERWICVLLP
jgi:hypothetical protein